MSILPLEDDGHGWRAAEGAAKLVPALREFLCREIDKCGADVLRVQGVAGAVEVRKGEMKEIRVKLDKDGFFQW